MNIKSIINSYFESGDFIDYPNVNFILKHFDNFDFIAGNGTGVGITSLRNEFKNQIKCKNNLLICINSHDFKVTKDESDKLCDTICNNCKLTAYELNYSNKFLFLSCNECIIKNIIE